MRRSSKVKNLSILFIYFFQSQRKVYTSQNIRFRSFSTITSNMAGDLNHLVFVYGTLKRNEPNYELIGNPKNGTAVYQGLAKTVQKWPLVIASRYNIPYILYKEGHGKNITGELYKVDDTMLSAMDKLEDHPSYYTRIQIEVELVDEDGNSGPSPPVLKNPWVYFLMNFKEQLLKLPYLDNYSSKGSHGLKYIERYYRQSNDNYTSDVKEIN